MNDETPSREAELVERLRRSYVSRGYDFIVEPVGADAPSFLANTVPDAIALSPNDNVVLEIKSSRASNSKIELVKFLAKEVPKHKGWRFELVIDDESGLNSDRNADPTLSGIKFEIDKVENLLNANDLKLGIVAGWATLEALSRKLVFSERANTPSRYKPRSVIEGLVSDGFVDDDDGSRLLEISQIRNQLVHGFTQIEIDPEDLKFLLAILKQMRDLAIGNET